MLDQCWDTVSDAVLALVQHQVDCVVFAGICPCTLDTNQHWACESDGCERRFAQGYQSFVFICGHHAPAVLRLRKVSANSDIEKGRGLRGRGGAGFGSWGVEREGEGEEMERGR